MAVNPIGPTRNSAFTRTALFGAFFSLPFFSGCSLQMKWVPALSRTSSDVTALSSFSATWAFDPLDSANYSFDSTKIDFTGGVCRLTGTDQVDDDNTATGFAGGTLSGVSWDATNTDVRLAQTGTPTNTAEFDASWTPNYSSILGYWKLNGSGSIANNAAVPAAIGTAGVATNANGTGMSYSAGKLNQGINFDGTDDDIDINNPGLSFTGDSFTITGWFKANAASSGRIGIFGSIQWDASYNNLSFMGIFIDASDGIDFESSDTNGIYRGAHGGGSYRDGSWHHFAAIRDKAGSTVAIYVDTFLVQSLADARTGNFNLASSPSKLVIGSDGATYFNGQIDEITLWDGALSLADVRKLYNRQSAKYSGTFTSRVMALATGQSWTTLSWKPTLPFLKELPDYSGGAIQNETSTDYSSLVGSTGTVGDNDLMTGIVGLWHMNESATGTAPGGKDIEDDSGNGYHGTIGGSSVLGVAGKMNNAIDFDATGLITLPPILNAGLSDDFTISSWANPATKCVAGNCLLLYDENYGVNGFRLGMVTWNGFPQWQFWSSESGGSITLAAPQTAAPDQWIHVAVTYKRSSGVARIYLNGAEAANITGTIVAPATTGTFFTLGNGGGEPFIGKADEVAIWSRALGAKEVLQLYRRGANRIKHQVRICAASDCSDDATGANWKGPDGTNQTYFSELNNNTVPLDGSGDVKKGLPSMLFSNFTSPVGTSRYFQYRTILESDDTGASCDYGSGATWCSPEVKSVSVDPVHYDSGAPTVTGKLGAVYASLDTLTESLGASCAGGITYNIGVGASEAAATWYWWDAARDSDCVSAGPGAWCPADGTATKSNAEAVLNAHLASFKSEVGAGTAYFKAFLHSSGTNACEIDQLGLSGLR